MKITLAQRSLLMQLQVGLNTRRKELLMRVQLVIVVRLGRNLNTEFIQKLGIVFIVKIYSKNKQTFEVEDSDLKVINAGNILFLR